MTLRRHRVVHLFRQLLATWPESSPDAPRSPEDLAADFQRAPPQVSPALAARLAAERGRARQMIGAAE